MVLPILQIGAQVLYQKSLDVPEDKIDSAEIKSLIANMLDTCKAHDEETAGLSAVQIGHLWRVFIIRRVDLENEQWEVCINPKVKVLGEKSSTVWEGCLSIGDGADRLFGPVERPDNVTLSYTDASGKQKSISATGYLSHIILHENDHLEGHLFLEYVQNPTLIWRSEDLDNYIAQTGHFPPLD